MGSLQGGRSGRLREINGTDYLMELMYGKDKLTKEKESSKVKEEKKDNVLDTISNILAAASFIPGGRYCYKP